MKLLGLWAAYQGDGSAGGIPNSDALVIDVQYQWQALAAFMSLHDPTERVYDQLSWPGAAGSTGVHESCFDWLDRVSVTKRLGL